MDDVRRASETPPDRKAVPPFEALRAFDAVARLGGVRRAAQWLERDHAVVSRHLRTLETWMGVKLIDRKAAGALLTASGARYHSIVAKAMDDIALGTLDLLNQGQHKVLTIFCAQGFALHWLSGRLEDFEAKNADVAFILRPSQRTPDFVAHEADVDIRLHPIYGEQGEVDPMLRVETVARVPIIAVASPDYLRKGAPIETPADLLDRHLLHEDNFDKWAKWLRSYDITDLDDLDGPRYSQGHITLEAARRGRGVALANALAAGEELKSGAIVDVGRDNPAFPARYGEYRLVMRRDRWDDRIPRRFRQWLRHVIARELPEFDAAN